jgi:hypothetical protein
MSIPFSYAGKPAVQVVAQDITERKRAQALLAGQKQVLELIVKGSPLATVLKALAQLVEEHAPDMRWSILVCDPQGNQLRFGAGPSLP